MISIASFYLLSHPATHPPLPSLLTFLQNLDPPVLRYTVMTHIFLSRNLPSMLSFLDKSEAKPELKVWRGEKSTQVHHQTPSVILEQNIYI